MNKIPFIIALLALGFLMIGWNAMCTKEAYASGIQQGLKQASDSTEYGLLRVIYEETDSVIVVHYYYDKKVNPNP
jgi:hypothetical protein